eukprot:MONOS_13402.1-p1 / transcript=MONOS_13402.1 / gene=MONOS_13402 / organism=Monocercomonoides_exilis_PA203 / gene_product=unspecified product / transcript_product=unspecified product / location=Mono_scaffold00822:23271-24509(-) / protein_length=412 / sequence_SO=supercontig / SO=protein_coding / is_pseudo=false
MDLGTVKKSLDDGFYNTTPKLCLKDITLIWDNCYHFNFPKDPVVTDALTLQNKFITDCTKSKLFDEDDLIITSEPNPNKYFDSKEFGTAKKAVVNFRSLMDSSKGKKMLSAAHRQHSTGLSKDIEKDKHLKKERDLKHEIEAESRMIKEETDEYNQKKSNRENDSSKMNEQSTESNSTQKLTSKKKKITTKVVSDLLHHDAKKKSNRKSEGGSSEKQKKEGKDAKERNVKKRANSESKQPNLSVLAERFEGDDIPLTVDEMEQMLQAISQFPEHFLAAIAQFLDVVSSCSANLSSDGAIEFDIGKMHPVVQRHLQKYVLACLARLHDSLNKNIAELPEEQKEQESTRKDDNSLNEAGNIKLPENEKSSECSNEKAPEETRKEETRKEEARKEEGEKEISTEDAKQTMDIALP